MPVPAFSVIVTPSSTSENVLVPRVKLPSPERLNPASMAVWLLAMSRVVSSARIVMSLLAPVLLLASVIFHAGRAEVPVFTMLARTPLFLSLMARVRPSSVVVASTAMDTMLPVVPS